MKTALPKLFGHNLKRLRKAKGLTQDAFAGLSGLSPPQISALESGKTNPTLETMEKLAFGLDVEIFELFSFAHAGATPAKVRNRLKALVDATDDQTLHALCDAMLMMVRS